MDTIQSNPFAERLQKAREGFAALAEEAKTGDIGEILDEICSDPANRQVLAEILLQMPVTVDPTNPEAGPDKRFALDVAETLGSDWAQAWYRFAVMVTKLA